jgi:hypothetical protein
MLLFSRWLESGEIQEVMDLRISGILNSGVLMSDDPREQNFGGSRKPSQRRHLKKSGFKVWTSGWLVNVWN